MKGSVISLMEFKRDNSTKEKSPDTSEKKIWPCFRIHHPQIDKPSIFLEFYKRGNEFASNLGIMRTHAESDFEGDYVNLNIKQESTDALNRVREKLAIMSQQHDESVWIIEKVIDTIFFNSDKEISWERQH